jgi:hypothetical protein
LQKTQKREETIHMVVTKETKSHNIVMSQYMANQKKRLPKFGKNGFKGN